MRLPKVRGYSISYTIVPGNPLRHHVTLWEQPLHRWLIATAYHWYDSCVFRLPGFGALERFLQRRHRDEELYVPLSCRQDIRCYFLHEQQRSVLAVLDIDANEFERIRGGAS